MPDVATVKRALTLLAEDRDHHPHDVVETAVRAVEDVELAAAFVEEVGTAELERAVETLTQTERRGATERGDGKDQRTLSRAGERALAAFARFRAASDPAADAEPSRNVFRHRMQRADE